MRVVMKTLLYLGKTVEAKSQDIVHEVFWTLLEISLSIRSFKNFLLIASGKLAGTGYQ